jgi:hypothetical protein
MKDALLDCAPALHGKGLPAWSKAFPEAGELRLHR